MLPETVAVTLVPYREALPGIDSLIAKLFATALPLSLPVPRAYWPLWFSGSYTQGASHIDLGNATTNVYFLAT